MVEIGPEGVCGVGSERGGDERLSIKSISTYYDEAQALKNVSLIVKTNEVVAILGSNGAGKSTLLKTLTGMLAPRHGSIVFEGEPIQGRPPYQIIGKGIASVPEGRELFGTMTVWDNLLLGAYSIKGKLRKEVGTTRLDLIFSLFPILKERLKQRAETMSGGQQQMLAVARALMANPKLLVLDEPSLGLSPLLISEMMRALKRICAESGVSILLVEQNARAALKIADHVYLLERGSVVLQGACSEVIESERIKSAYLGG